MKTFILIYTFFLSGGTSVDAEGEMIRLQNAHQCEQVAIEQERRYNDINGGESKFFTDVTVTCKQVR